MMKHLLSQAVFNVNAIESRKCPSARRKGQGTPLDAAVAPQDADRLRLLLEHEAYMDRKNTLGQTALEDAAAGGLWSRRLV